MIKNPQANGILRCAHQVVTNTMQTSSLQMKEICTPNMIDRLIASIDWDIHSTYHIVLGSTPGA
jgi:hypothetical protein